VTPAARQIAEMRQVTPAARGGPMAIAAPRGGASNTDETLPSWWTDSAKASASSTPPRTNPVPQLPEWWIKKAHDSKSKSQKVKTESKKDVINID